MVRLPALRHLKRQGSTRQRDSTHIRNALHRVSPELHPHFPDRRIRHGILLRGELYLEQFQHVRDVRRRDVHRMRAARSSRLACFWGRTARQGSPRSLVSG